MTPRGDDPATYSVVCVCVLLWVCFAYKTAAKERRARPKAKAAVAKRTLSILSEIEASMLAPHAATILQLLGNVSASVRQCAIEVLSKVEASALRLHAASIVRFLRDGRTRTLSAAISQTRSRMQV